MSLAGAGVTLLALVWVGRGGFTDAGSYVQLGVLWTLGFLPYGLYLAAPRRFQRGGPNLGGLIAGLAVGLPGLAIAPVVLSGDAQGGTYILGLPIYVGIAVGIGIAGGTLLQRCGRFLAPRLGPRYGKLAKASTVLGLCLALAWSATIWPSVEQFVAACEEDPPIWAQERSAKVPTKGPRIVFVSWRDPKSWGERLRQRFASGDVGSDVYVMRANGTDQTRLTTDACHYSTPRFSSDGSRIAFESRRSDGSRLFAMSSDGTAMEPVTDRDVYTPEFDWSPDGSSIAYYSAPEDAVHVVQLDAARRDRRVYRSRHTVVCLCFQLIDESHIALVEGREIVIVNLETHEKRVALELSDEDVDDSMSTTNPEISDFSLSPDGTTFALAKDREVPIPGGFAYATEIFVAKAGGSEVRRITPEGRSERSPSWSPDGGQLVFDSASVVYRRGAPSANIYIANGDGTHRQQLTTVGGQSPHWIE